MHEGFLVASRRTCWLLLPWSAEVSVDLRKSSCLQKSNDRWHRDTIVVSPSISNLGLEWRWPFGRVSHSITNPHTAYFLMYVAKDRCLPVHTLELIKIEVGGGGENKLQISNFAHTEARDLHEAWHPNPTSSLFPVQPLAYHESINKIPANTKQYFTFGIRTFDESRFVELFGRSDLPSFLACIDRKFVDTLSISRADRVHSWSNW